MYNLDFSVMRQILHEHRETGKLYADVPSGIAPIRGSCRIEITMKAGDVTSCIIVNESGDRVAGNEAIQKLARLGRMRWTFTSQSNAVELPATSALSGGKPLIPRRTTPVGQLQIRSWSRLHKLVFALADGTTSAAKIAETLSATPELVNQALSDLQAIGVIVMEQSR